MFKQSNFPEKMEGSINFCYNDSSSVNKKRNNNIKEKSKKRVFEVFHKKEMIYSKNDSIFNKIGQNNPIFQYKCIYCGNKYNNMNRFEAHMRIHVS